MPSKLYTDYDGIWAENALDRARLIIRNDTLIDALTHDTLSMIEVHNRYRLSYYPDDSLIVNYWDGTKLRLHLRE